MRTARPQKLTRVAARSAATLALPLAVLGLAGCGPGAGGSSGVGAQISITHDFGAKLVKTVKQQKIPGSETVMALLQRSVHVGTAYSGSFVQSIDGASGDQSARIAWFYYVNGTLGSQGAAQTPVRSGDRIWWDFHNWKASEGTPAVVGSYPAPFTTGLGGRRLRTVLECAADAAVACKRIDRVLDAAGVDPMRRSLSGSAVSGAITVQVGTWGDLRDEPAGELIASGVKHSGVYATFAGTGISGLRLDNPMGAVARTLTGDAGLIAATQPSGEKAPTWVVTGTDVAAVQVAADDFSAASLRGHFAVAVSDSQTIPIPVDAAR